MSVSINEMRDFVSSGLDDIPSSGDDFGTIINLSEIGDDMGASLLANNRSAPAQSKSVSFDIGGGSGGGGGIEILDHLDSNSFDINLGPDPLAPRAQQGPSIQIHHEDSTFGSPAPAPSWSFGSEGSTAATGFSDPEVEKKEKADLVTKLRRLEDKGYPVSRRFTMDNTLDEMRTEYARLVDAKQLEASIKFQRTMLMSVVTGAEFLNEKFDPFDLQLKGWSESVHENAEDFDDVFEELHDKYKGKSNMPPEIKLVMALVSSGFMYHMSNSFFRKNMPTVDDIFKQNPGLQRQFAAAAANAAGPGFGNFMGSAMGMAPGPAPTSSPTGMFYGSSVPQGQMPPQMPQNMMAQEQPKAQRREMKGPSGVDDILRTFEDARRQDSEPMFSPFGTGTSPSGNVIIGNGGGTADIQQPAVNAVSEIQSVISDDIGSMTESRRGGGRRRKAQPIGNTMSLNI